MADRRMSNASSLLVTPTDIKPDAVKAISKVVNGLVADAFALYVKTKNFHWHLSGPNFRDFHKMLDEQAEQIYASIDPLAERVRKLGGTTIKSISHIAELQSLKDNNAEFAGPLEMLNELRADNNLVAAAMRKAHKVCDENEDVASASLLEVFLDETERRVWFLFESSRASDESGH